MSRRIAWRSVAGWALPAAIVAAALVFALLPESSRHAVLTTAARAGVGVLVLIVSRASVHMAHKLRVFARHESIRNDIAAAGGLGQRLSV